eukprot:TRINITY_DN5116_c1_g2_i2.p2 TRINITY_DN5116_c1_g2~~TRINITY_DN5116_c1_g2_i2.p2  ORF type:complete len:197 (-),score=-10.59 TRINITY_DN5116_c1_g2_i2:37-627(-)
MQQTTFQMLTTQNDPQQQKKSQELTLQPIYVIINIKIESQQLYRQYNNIRTFQQIVLNQISRLPQSFDQLYLYKTSKIKSKYKKHKKEKFEFNNFYNQIIQQKPSSYHLNILQRTHNGSQHCQISYFFFYMRNTPTIYLNFKFSVFSFVDYNYQKNNSLQKISMHANGDGNPGQPQYNSTDNQVILIYIYIFCLIF